MLGDGLVDIGLLGALRREVARRLNAEVDGPVGLRLGKRRSEVDGSIVDDFRPFLFGQIKLNRFQRSIASRRALHRADAVLVIILDRLAPAFQRLVGRGVADDEVAIAEMVEQGLQPLFEQRQPMLHACHPAPFRHRLVERILRRRRAEFLAVAGTEALDAVGV